MWAVIHVRLSAPARNGEGTRRSLVGQLVHSQEPIARPPCLRRPESKRSQAAHRCRWLRLTGEHLTALHPCACVRRRSFAHTRATRTPPQAEPDLNTLSGLSIVGVQQIGRVVEVVQEALQGNTVRLLGKSSRPSLELPKIRKNPLVEIIPCNTGCLGACTYCKTVHARGRLGSYSLDALAARLKTALSEGVAEIWLTSEDTGAYGRDIGSSMPELMETLLEGAHAQPHLLTPTFSRSVSRHCAHCLVPYTCHMRKSSLQPTPPNVLWASELDAGSLPLTLGTTHAPRATGWLHASCRHDKPALHASAH